MNLIEDPKSGLLVPRNFVDEKESLKKVIEDYLEKVVNQYQYRMDTYFLTFHAKFNPNDPSEFMLDPPKITDRLPPFISNSMVYWINNKKGICELLWMVPPKKPGEKKLRVEFNTEGVAYLQAKGAMPKG